MHEVSVLSDFLDLFITFIFLLSFFFILKQFLLPFNFLEVKIDFTPTPGGWDLTMTLDPPERSNKVLNKAVQEISVRKRANVETRDNGAITDTEWFVNIMGCDPFRRRGISP